MKTICLVLFMLTVVVGFGQQNDKSFLVECVSAFHKALVRNDTLWLKALTDENLVYGHSNGWVQNKREMLDDLKSGLLTYQRFDEDGVSVAMNDKNTMASVCFAATIDATMKGVANTFHLKVLEVWAWSKEHKNWMLFARQAVKG